MGIEYDGANYKDVSWGERKRGILTVEAGWDNADLVVKTTGGRKPIKETYSLSEDGSRLRVILEIDGGKDNNTYTRVYDKQPAAPSS